MASPTPSALPPGYRAPLALVDDDHHGAWVHICNAFGLTVVLITLAVRVWIRRKISPPFSYDDYTLLAATILSITQSGLTFGEVHQGLGTSMKLIKDADLVRVQKISYAADIFYIFSIYVGKCSVVLLFKRLTADRKQVLVSWALLAGCCIFACISTFLVALRCNTARPWIQYNVSCGNLNAQWIAVAAFDIISEVWLFLTSILLVWGLYTKAANKGRVVLVFAIRLPIIAVIVLRLVYLQDEIESDDPTLAAAIPAVLSQVEMFYGIMSATVPCLRPFLAGFATNYGAMGGGTVIGGSQVASGAKKDQNESNSGSFHMGSLTSRSHFQSKHRRKLLCDKMTRSRSRDMPSATEINSWRQVPANNRTTVTRGSQLVDLHDRSSVGSNDSTRLIIKKQVEFRVGSEHNTGIDHLKIDGEGKSGEYRSS
ncbi:hypothetical protein DOTSEDRAFT_160788 [Dothistroma septosporum NZE10]|uniref:Rhodopsin domain-containing protein n=1 Tax=Dothistroma septosporum (strain NZE10 / CBS 128990) TaxID=675120 RepID=M2Y0Y7_DOTSN|nr:hypothetical protein DOTSEDRAFT_160788 [Dothistroma septosporum NZE10]